MKNLETATREEVYNFYDWMLQNKEYLDKIPLDIIKESISSNGLSNRSVCLYNGKGYPGCHCNTCLDKITSYNGYSKNIHYYHKGRIVKIKSICPLENCKTYFIVDATNKTGFCKWLSEEEVKKEPLIKMNNSLDTIVHLNEQIYKENQTEV